MDDGAIEVSSKSDLVAQPTLSVLMITYNHEPYIAEAIRSILSQSTDFKFELVIGEDCSSDRTREVLSQFQSAHPEVIRIVQSEKNVGVNANFVRTYRRCRGQYIAICEGDDYWQDNLKLQKQVDFLSQNPSFSVVFHDVKMIDVAGNVLAEQMLQKKGTDYNESELLMTRILPTQTLCFRNVLGDLPDEIMNVTNIDSFLISMFGLHGSAKYLNETIVPSIYRVHSGGIWSGISRHKRVIASATSFYWLSKYHGRHNRKDVSNNFLCSAVSALLAESELSRGRVFLLLLSVMFPELRRSLKKILRKV